MFSQTKMQLWYPNRTSGEDGKKPRSDAKDARRAEGRRDECNAERIWFGSDGEDEEVGRRRKRRPDPVSDFIDLDYWKKEVLCCGTVFRGRYGEVLVDQSLVKPCANRLAMMKKGPE